jgi:hypothetical protein
VLTGGAQEAERACEGSADQISFGFGHDCLRPLPVTIRPRAKDPGRGAAPGRARIVAVSAISEAPAPAWDACHPAVDPVARPERCSFIGSGDSA